MKRLFTVAALLVCLAFLMTGVYAANRYFDGYNVIDSNGVFDIYAYKVNYQVITTNDSLTAAESGKVTMATHQGSGTLTVTLPTAAAGLMYTVSAASAGTLYVDPAVGDTILYGTSPMDAGDKLGSPAATGDSVTLMCPVANKWVIKAMVGTWTDAGTTGE